MHRRKSPHRQKQRPLAVALQRAGTPAAQHLSPLPAAQRASRQPPGAWRSSCHKSKHVCCIDF